MRLLALVAAALPAMAASGPAVLETAGFKVELDQATAAVQLTDKKTAEVWDLGSPHIVFVDQSVARVKPARVAVTADAITYSAEPQQKFELKLSGSAVVYSFSGPFVPFVGSEIQEVQLLREALPVGPGPANYYAVPNRMGVLAVAGPGRPFSYRLPAYQTWGPGYSMAMFGAVKNGSALLVTWDAPYGELMVSGPERLAMGIGLRHSARRIRLQPLGRGGYVEIAKAYRPLARERGLLKTMAERLKEKPELEKLIGAADIKPFTFVRHLRENRNEINFSFDEAASLAEHFRRDLGMDRAMLILAGWIRRGYDNQHPDILPAAPELGGNEALADCSRRAKALGWIFGLHDNYQDLYKDAPSWTEDAIIKNPDGSLLEGGSWAGGQCYIVCSRKGLEFAMRPENLPRVRELFGPTAYFIDCTTANRLKECHDPHHPTTKAEDIKYRVDLLDFTRRQFGIFGSEEGFEWAVPHAEYFEGLMSHKTGFNIPSAPGIVIPLFELVYGDSIAIYAHQGDRVRPDNPTYILDHILYAEMPVYEFGRHRFWTEPGQQYKAPANAGDRMIFTRGGKLGVVDQFIKNTYEVLSAVNRETALLPMTDHRFVTADRSVERTRFGTDVEITVNYGPEAYEMGGVVLPRYGFVVKSPRMEAFCATRYDGVSYTEPTLMVRRGGATYVGFGGAKK